MINIGEGVRRAPEFMEEMIYTTEHVSHVDECNPHKIQDYEQRLFEAIK